MSTESVYLDYAAATPVSDEALAAMAPFWQAQFYNPSSLYDAARALRREHDQSRRIVASVLGAQPGEVIFTAGGTEANLLAVCGTLKQHGGNIIVSAVEHSSITAAAESVVNTENIRVAPVDKRGRVKLKELEQLIDDQTTMVSVQYANHEIGTVQPIADIAKLVKRIREQRGSHLPLYLHTDASQAATLLDLHVSRLDVDLMSLNGGKFYGPKQSGALYMRGGTNLAPLMRGGGQERGLRGGTENLALSRGLAVALKQSQDDRQRQLKRSSELRRHFVNQLETDLPEVEVNGAGKDYLPNVLSISTPGFHGETLLHWLDAAGFMVGTGAACQAGSDEPAPTLLAIGQSPEQANSSLRISFGRSTTQQQIQQFTQALRRVMHELKQQEA